MADESLDDKPIRFHIPYQVIHHEAYMSLHKELSEPFRFDDTKLNKRFGANHRFSLLTEPAVIYPRSQSSLTSEYLRGGYELCVNFTNPSLMVIGNSMLDGNLLARMKYDYTDRLTMYSQIMNNQTLCSSLFSFDYKRAGYKTQVQAGSDVPFKASCSKNVTPELSLHGEVSWNGNDDVNNDVGFAARYARYESETNKPKMIAVAQVFTKSAIMSYFQKISEKVMFVTYLTYNYMSRDVRARVGCVYSVRRGRVLANIDSNGVLATHLEERWVEGLNFILSTELDPKRWECKVGCGITITT
ncbi:unnamed protein product [Arabidopsis arenosa]|uniref:Uncharacterized protein n=1 Tax=Arabidopsis arenosa TaxID=38785 RepID=A0A8S1ZDQ9_ARAAE|nr:unnamed protein product [Arabidopsis arenosa]